MERNNGYTYIRRQGQNMPSSGNIDGNGRTTSSSMQQREPLTQHDELIRYIKEAWHKVVNEPHGGPVYCNESDQPHLKNFKPFDLDGYWGQRIVQNIHVSQGHQ